MPEPAAQQDTYDEVAKKLVAEDRKKRIFDNKMEAALDDYHKRTYGEPEGDGAPSSSSSSKKRQATDTMPPMEMEVDEWAAAEESVDYSEELVEV